eukprot:767956-Hanusia_phi.AAC.8
MVAAALRHLDSSLFAPALLSQYTSNCIPALLLFPEHRYSRTLSKSRSARVKALADRTPPGQAH